MLFNHTNAMTNAPYETLVCGSKTSPSNNQAGYHYIVDYTL